MKRKKRNTPLVLLNLHVSVDIKAAAQKEADRRGVSRGQVMREWLDAGRMAEIR